MHIERAHATPVNAGWCFIYEQYIQYIYTSITIYFFKTHTADSEYDEVNPPNHLKRDHTGFLAGITIEVEIIWNTNNSGRIIQHFVTILIKAPPYKWMWRLKKSSNNFHAAN